MPQIEDQSPVTAAPSESRTSTHPILAIGSGKTLEMPPEHQLSAEGSILLQRSARGSDTVALRPIVVIAQGEDVDTGASRVAVRFETNAGTLCEQVIPVEDLADPRALVKALAPFDAPVMTGKRGVLMIEYLDAFRKFNRDKIPRTLFTERLGWHGNGVTGLGWQIGKAPLYSGSFVPRLEVPTRRDAYREALREIHGWGEEAWALWLALGLALTSPIMAMHRPTRNPILGLHGPSGSGKTTALRFATGLYADPELEPFTIQGGPQTSAKGILQTFEQLRGFPTLLDEVHLTDSGTLESVVYNFANAQSYSRGGKDGTPRQTPDLRGVLLMAGEASPGFANAGSHNRTLMIDTALHPPLGVLDDPKRADLLEQAWRDGAGVMGRETLELILTEEKVFLQQVKDLEQDLLSKEFLTLPGREWARALAFAQLGIVYLYRVAGLSSPVIDVTAPAIAALAAGRVEHDPARDAMQSLVSLVMRAEDKIEGSAHYRTVHGQKLALKQGEKWIVMHHHQALIQALEPWGGENAVKRHAQRWIKNGWVEPDGEGKSTQPRNFNGGRVRCLVLTPAALQIGEVP